MRPLSRSYLQHGRRHGIHGSDPIPFPADRVGFPALQQLPLGVESQLVGSPGDWLTTIDPTRKGNWKLEYAGAGTGTLRWPVLLGPASGGSAYSVWLNTAIGVGYGTMTAMIAGAYPDPFTPPGGGDWITLSTLNFSNGSNVYYPYLRIPTSFATYVSGPDGPWVIGPADIDFGVKSTAVDGSGNLDGGPGYFWFRIDLTDYTELSEVWIIRD